MNTIIPNPNITQFPLFEADSHSDDRGMLTFVDAKEKLPFAVKRVFWIYDVPQNKTRGGHAHTTCHELVFAVKGAFTMVIDDGREKKSYRMDKPETGIFIEAGIWCELSDFEPDTVCLVLASQQYDPTGYINGYDEYLTYRSKIENKSL